MDRGAGGWKILMLGDLFHIPEATHADVQVFNANSPTAAGGWATWTKRRGISMVMMYAWGGGGAGGNGVVGAVSTAAGGGGGGSGGQSILLVPAIFLPDTLFVSVGVGGMAPNAAGVASRIAVWPDIVTNDCVLLANGGGAGGNGAGATGGTAGAAGAAATTSNCAYANIGMLTLLAGQAGAAGGTTGAGPTAARPVSLPPRGAGLVVADYLPRVQAAAVESSPVFRAL
jgi:hypothetical protein